MDQQNLYQILDLPDFAEEPEIKRAFRRMALKLHPDRNPSPTAAEDFLRITRAYEILSNPVYKATYDRRLRQGDGFATIFTTPEPDPRVTMRKKWYERRMQAEAVREFENFNRYERSLDSFSLVKRYVLLSLLSLSAMLLIVNSWYSKSSGTSIGFIMIVGCVLLFWNEVYKHHWYLAYKADTLKPGETGFEIHVSRTVIQWVFIAFIVLFLMIRLKKAWHLSQFETIVVAEVLEQQHEIIYGYGGKSYTSDYFSLPDYYKGKGIICITISSREPEIWEFRETDP